MWIKSKPIIKREEIDAIRLKDSVKIRWRKKIVGRVNSTIHKISSKIGGAQKTRRIAEQIPI